MARSYSSLTIILVKSFIKFPSRLQILILVQFNFPLDFPSFAYVFEDFPSPIAGQNIYRGVTEIIYDATTVNILLILAILLLFSFIKSGYFNVINKAGNNANFIKDYIIEGNRTWWKFFVLYFLEIIPFTIAMINEDYAWLILINIIYLYILYSFVVNKDSNILSNFKNGISFLYHKVWLTLKICLFFGLIISFAKNVFYVLIEIGMIGIVIDSIIIVYIGVVMNMVVMDCYREPYKSDCVKKQSTHQVSNI